MRATLQGVEKLEKRRMAELSAADETKAGKTAAQAETLVMAAVVFAFKLHQFVGGFNEACETLIVDLRSALNKQEAGGDDEAADNED